MNIFGSTQELSNVLKKGSQVEYNIVYAISPKNSWPAAQAFILALTIAVPAQSFAQEADTSLKDAIEQALLYFKRDRVKRARIELERARSLPGGDSNGALYYYLARTYTRLGLIDRAFPAAERANDLAASDKRLARKTKELVAKLNSLYGAVHFRADNADTAPVGSIVLDSKSPIINQTSDGNTSRCERFRSTFVYSTTYFQLTVQIRLNLSHGEITTVNLDLVKIAGAQAPEARRNDSSNLWLYIGIGVGVAAAAGVGGWFLFNNESSASPTAADYPM